MRDSKQQHKLLKVTRNTTNRDKHINEASKQAFANNLFELSCKYTQDMLFKWKICFNVFNIRTYDEVLCNLSKISETAQKATSTNFPVSSQQTTKTTSNCNANSFGPVCQLSSITFKCMRDSKPQRCVQHHKSLEVTQNAINRDKHINEAFKQTFANNLVKISYKNMQGKPFNWNVCFNVFT